MDGVSQVHHENEQDKNKLNGVHSPTLLVAELFDEILTVLWPPKHAEWPCLLIAAVKPVHEGCYCVGCCLLRDLCNRCLCWCWCWFCLCHFFVCHDVSSYLCVRSIPFSRACDTIALTLSWSPSLYAISAFARKYKRNFPRFCSSVS